MGLAELIPASDPVSFRTARVISVSSHTLQVDLGGPVQVVAADGCNPRPDDYVLLAVDSSGMRAIATFGGPYKQATVTVVSSTSTTVTGLLNGASTVIPKSGVFTVIANDICPLLWAADGSRVWVCANEQALTAPPVDGGGSGGAPGGVTTGKSTYAPTSSWSYKTGIGWGNTAGGTAFVTGTQTPAFFYGGSRFRELQGRTITGFRAYLPGSGAPTVWGHPHGSVPGGAPTLGSNAGARGMGGWVSLPISLANYLIAGSGTGGLAFTGSGTVSGVPNGALEITWRR